MRNRSEHGNSLTITNSIPNRNPGHVRRELHSERVGHGVAAMVLRKRDDAPATGGIAFLTVPGLNNHNGLTREPVAKRLSSRFPVAELRHGGRADWRLANPNAAMEQLSKDVHAAARYVDEVWEPDTLVYLTHSMGGLKATKAVKHDQAQPRGRRIQARQVIIREATPNTHGLGGVQSLRAMARLGFDAVRHPIDYFNMTARDLGHAVLNLRKMPVEEAILAAEAIACSTTDITDDIRDLSRAGVVQLNGFYVGDELVVNQADNCRRDVVHTNRSLGHMASWHDPEVLDEFIDPVLEYLNAA